MQVVRIWLPTCKKDLYTVQKKPPPVSQDGDNAGGTSGLPPATTLSVITIDTLLYATKDLGDNPNVVDVIDYINQPSKNSYFTQYFKFHKAAIDAIRDYQTQVVEGFDVGDRPAAPPRPDPHFTVYDNVEGVHVYVPVGDYYELHCKPGLRLNGLRARLGDRVLLQGQTRDSENAYYYVSAVNEKEILLTTVMILKTTSDPGPAVSDEVWVTDTQERGTMTATGLVTRSAKVSAVGPPQCVEDPTLMTEEACLAANKTWDAQCVRDDACPYFKGAASDYRGGCTPSSGYCEMPLGVTRVGYTKTSGRPFYDGCPIESADTCKDGKMRFTDL
jgi:hypothetical protein